jgi:hypothetical protein
MPTNNKLTLDELVDGIDLPHKRHAGWEWKHTGATPANKPGFSRERIVHYVEVLRSKRMSDTDIVCLISDLYWDSFHECLKNKTFTKSEK